MRILVTGRQGQLARSLIGHARPGIEIIAVGRPELDIADAGGVSRAVERIGPDIVVNAAAYTAVDRAEDEPEAAFKVNAEGAGNVARAAAAAGIAVIQVSTDYVFSGAGSIPYMETDAVHPLGIYGKSKLDGERAVAAANPAHAIVRTAWVHGEHGANFVKTMLRLARERESVSVVADQTGTPTYAPDLAGAIVAICERAVSQPGAVDWRGTFHVVSQGTTHWADFASEIFRQSAALGGPSAKVVPITTSQFPTRALRPAFSVLDTSRFGQTFRYRLPPWQDGVARCVAAILKAN